MELESNYRTLKDRMAQAFKNANRSDDLHLIAVSKSKSIEDIARLHKLGQRDFAENYVQELIMKAKAAQSMGLKDIKWHFIGHLQSNKCKDLLRVCNVIHSVDRASIVREIAKQKIKLGILSDVEIFLQVNIDDETSKDGVGPDGLAALIQACDRAEAVSIQGLMCIPKPGSSSRDAFRKLRELLSSLGNKGPKGLSMGMSADFEDAIAEGATHIRVGSLLFGARP
jgi:pyridoxal phosphate enzyme (YggS family)